MAHGEVRTKMVEGAVILLATRGLEGTSFSEVLKLTGAPRGSIYHHFPGGKTELVMAALDRASDQAFEAMEATRGQSAVAVVQRFLNLWGELLSRSKLRAGCAVLAVSLDGSSEELRTYCGTIFARWTQQLAGLCAEGGIPVDAAPSLASLVIAATEGAVAMCRAEGTRQPFEDVSGQLLRLAALSLDQPA